MTDAISTFPVKVPQPIIVSILIGAPIYTKSIAHVMSKKQYWGVILDCVSDPSIILIDQNQHRHLTTKCK